MKLILLLLIANLSIAQDIIIKDPTTAEKRISANGYDGSDGKQGSDGSDGSCSYCEETDTYSSDSGSYGGDGSNGEDGGDGDDVLIHYSDINQLKDFTIHSYGGDGGKGGAGGYGGSGCNGGSDGSDGSSGRDGYNGSKGYLYLVASPNEYSRDITSHSSSIEKLTSSSAQMILNYWDSKSGANDLLAQGSVIQDKYYEFIKVNKMNVSILWDSNKLQTDYNQTNLYFSFDGEKIEVTFHNTFVDYVVEYSEGGASIIIKNIYKRDELLDFSDFTISGQRQNLVLKLKANSSDLVIEDLDLGVEVFKKRFLSKHYVSVHNQRSAKDIVNISKNEIVINLGQLPINSRFLKRKKYIEVNVTMTISVFGKTLSRTYELAHQVGYPMTIIK